MKTIRRSCALASILSLLVCVILAASSIWRVMQRSSELCKDENLSGSLHGLQVVWKVVVENGVAYPPLVLDEYVIVVDRRDTFSTRTSNVDIVLAYDRASGTLLWRYPSNISTRTGYIETIKGYSPYIILNIRRGSEGNKVVVLDVSTGASVFEIADTAVDVAVNEKLIAYQDSGRALHLYRIDTGSQLWSTAWTERTNRVLDFREEALYSIRSMKIVRYDKMSGAEVLTVTPTTQTGQNLNAIVAALLDDAALLASGTQLTYFDLENGNELWSVLAIDDREVKSNLWPPAEDAISLFVITDPSTLIALSKSDGAILWELQPNDAEQYVAPPAIRDGTLYAMWSDGSLHEIDILTVRETALLLSTGTRNAKNTGYYSYQPGITLDNDMIFVTFGCKTLYAFATQ